MQREPNKERIQEWVAALRSGKYEQGQHRLKKDGQYCCLGVACEISGLGEFINDIYMTEQYEEESELPPNVVTYFGLPDENPIVMHPNQHEGEISLAELNDEGYNFTEIADIIEKKFLHTNTL